MFGTFLDFIDYIQTTVSEIQPRPTLITTNPQSSRDVGLKKDAANWTLVSDSLSKLKGDPPLCAVSFAVLLRPCF